MNFEGNLNFNQEWDKLKPGNFKSEALGHTVRWGDKYEYYLTKVDKVMRVRVNKIPRGYVEITMVLKEPMYRLELEFIQRDTYSHWTKKDFFNTMRKFYYTKPDWAGWNSEITVIYYKIKEVIRHENTLESYH